MADGTLNIEKLADRDEHATVLIYGESGTGKTVFASSAPRPMLWLEAEGGTASISDKDGIDIVKMSGLESYREVLRYLEANPGKYKTIVIDSLTETAVAIMKEIMKAAKGPDSSRDEHAPHFPEWGKLTGVIREIVRAFRDLPTHLVITALQREDTDEMTARVKVRPGLTPRLADELPALMDAVLYLYAATQSKGEADSDGIAADEDGNTVVRNALIKPTGKYVAKARIPMGNDAPDFINNPTFTQVADLIGVSVT